MPEDEIVFNADKGEEGLMVYRPKTDERGYWRIADYGPHELRISA